MLNSYWKWAHRPDGGALRWAPESSQQEPNPLNALWYSYLPLSWSPFPQSLGYHLNTLGAAGEKQKSPAASHIARHSFTFLPFSHRGGHCHLVQLHTVTLWKEWCWQFLLNSTTPKLFVIVPTQWSLSLGRLEGWRTFTKALLSMGFCPSQHSALSWFYPCVT